MNDEQRIDRQLRDFYLDDASRAHDRGAILRDVLDTVHDTPQRRRRRWWPFRRHAALTSPLPSRELQPDLTTVTANGQAAAPGGSTPLLYGALRFVVATAIVAIFGGFLLFGVLAPGEPSSLPGASGSASPETSPMPEETTMDLGTPAATMAVVLATMAPGTGVAAVEPDFVTEQVEAGVERIISDGADYDLTALPENIRYAFEDIAVSPDGDVFVATYRYHTDTGRTEGPFVMELGTPGGTGTQEGFPTDFEKIIVDDDGALVVASPSGIKRLDGEVWVDSPGTVSVQTGGGTIWFAEPGDVSGIGGASTDHRAGVLVLSADYAGYAEGDEVGYRFIKDWPTWWESCNEQVLGYRNGTGCIDRGIEDDRGVGAGHDDENRALFLEGVATRRIAAPPGGDAVWVLAGPAIEDFWSGSATGDGAIYRIDSSAPGFECPGC